MESNEAARPTTSKPATIGVCIHCQENVPATLSQAAVEVLRNDELKGYLHLRCRAEWEDAHPKFTYRPVHPRLHIRK